MDFAGLFHTMEGTSSSTATPVMAATAPSLLGTRLLLLLNPPITSLLRTLPVFRSLVDRSREPGRLKCPKSSSSSSASSPSPFVGLAAIKYAMSSSSSSSSTSFNFRFEDERCSPSSRCCSSLLRCSRSCCCMSNIFDSSVASREAAASRSCSPRPAAAFFLSLAPIGPLILPLFESAAAGCVIPARWTPPPPPPPPPRNAAPATAVTTAATAEGAATPLPLLLPTSLPPKPPPPPPPPILPVLRPAVTVRLPRRCTFFLN
mmetsp:Transcript_25449/g.42447  ORF Transcript_25449/g.42447 Transcript_25449/m.42447 type:complete len:261 (+) Transcript_25449:1185-1967(+)